MILSRAALILITVFTAVETVVLTAWLILVKPEPVAAAVVLFIGLEAEHLLAGVSNKV